MEQRRFTPLEKKYKNSNFLTGFTLLELMVVLVIIGILASIALPQYYRSRERAMDKQAKAILSLIRAAERTYKMEIGSYYTAGGNVDTINQNLNLDIANDGNWAYGMGSGGGGFIATLSRDKGGYDRTWTINANSVNATCSGGCP